MNYKVTIFGVIILIGIIAAGAWFYFNSQQTSIDQPATDTDTSKDATSDQNSTDQTPKQTLANISPEDYQTQFDKNFQTSKTKAVEWQKNAQFVFLQISISSDLNLKKITETYTYQAPSENYYLWTANIDLEGNFLRALIPKTDYLSDQKLKQINIKYWNANWIKAFQSAEASGGKEFRDQYGDELEIYANLGYLGPKNFLAWEIKYRSLTDEAEIETYLIDAYTGENFNKEE